MVQIVDNQVLVYGDIDATALPIFVLTTGDVVTVEGVVQARGQEWLKIRDALDTVGFMDRQTRVRAVQSSAGNGCDAAESLFAQGLGLACARLFATAVPLLQQVVCHYPHSEWADDAQMVLAISYYHQGDYPLAQHSFQKLVESYPQSEYVSVAARNLEWLIGQRPLVIGQSLL